MALISRSVKVSGGTTLVANTTARAADVETDMATVFNEINGGLSNANLVSAAAIDPEKIDDHQSTAAEQKLTTDPGVSGSTSLATDLAIELRTLRYTIERLGFGVAPVRVDGSGNTTAGWIDVPARGPNLIPGRFYYIASSSSAPPGWTLVGTPTLSVNASTTQNTSYLLIDPNAPGEGIRYTFSPKPSTRYLFVCQYLLNNSPTLRLTCTGADAASNFRSFTIDDTSVGGSIETAAAIVQSDSTPTDLVFSILENTGVALDTVLIFAVGLYECSNGFGVTSPAGFVVQDSDATNTANHYTTGGWAAVQNLDVTVYIPCGGCQIEVLGVTTATNTSATSQTLRVDLQQNVDAGGAASARLASGGLPSSNTGQTVVDYVRDAEEGSFYNYTMNARTSLANANSNDANTTPSTLTVRVSHLG